MADTKPEAPRPPQCCGVGRCRTVALTLVRVSEVVDPVQAVASIVARAEAAAGAADGDAVAALEQAHRELQELLAEGEV